MCKFASEVKDTECKRQYVAHVVFLGDEYDVVCNINHEGTTDVVPVNDRGKVNGRGKTFIGTKRPTARMIRDVLGIDRWFPCDIQLEAI